MTTTLVTAAKPHIVIDGALDFVCQELDQVINNRPTFIIIDAQVSSLWCSQLCDSLKNSEVDIYTVPAGEACKTMAEYQQLLYWLADKKCPRQAVLIAVGGGATSDLVGFVAATYMRGLDWVALPTTLLAMVDAAVGGKTAVNLPQGKNLVGAFHAPCAILMATEFLTTIPRKPFNAAWAEMIKYGVLFDPDLLNTIQRYLKTPSDVQLLGLIKRCVDLKSALVAQDFKDTGNRNWLNLGHTLAHALEIQGNPAHILHGEAVALGLVFSLAISVKLQGLPREVLSQVIDLLHQCGLSTDWPQWAVVSALPELMRHDKKSTSEAIRMVLLSAMAKPVWPCEVDQGVILSVLDQLSSATYSTANFN